MREVNGQERNVGDALVALVLKVMLGQPQRLVAELVGGLGKRRRSVEGLDQPPIGIPPAVGGSAGEAARLQLDVAHVERREARDHRVLRVVDQRPPAR